MDGVEILNQYTIASDVAFNMWAFVAILTIFIVAGILTIAASDSDFSWMVIPILLGILFGCIGGTIVGKNAPTPEQQITRYEVVIDDSVSMTEFSQKYKVIEQHGKIYVVEEKDNERIN